MIRNDRNFRKSALSERVAQFGRPCRGLTLAGFAPNCSCATLIVYMTRRAFLSSKSNTAAGEIEIKKASQKSWQIARKNEDISESVSSIDSGPIF